MSTEPSPLPQEVERVPLEALEIEGKGGLKSLPWWLFALILVSIWVGLVVLYNDNYQEAFLFIIAGARTTITVSLSAYGIALVLGLIAGLGRISQSVVLNNLATFYVEFVRGIPMLVLIFFIALVGVPTTVTTAIFESMKSHEETKAQRYIAEGEARAQDIRAAAKAVERRIMAAAQQKVAEMRKSNYINQGIKCLQEKG